MTCDEFKQIVNKNILDCTRAERSAVGVHTEHCSECRGWFWAGIMVQKPTLQELKEAWQFGEMLLQHDKQDPEYV